MPKLQKNYNGKPLSYWEDQATEIVIEALLRGYFNYDSNYCLPAKLAAQKLLNLALGINEPIVKKLIKERSTCQEGIARTFAGILLPKGKRERTNVPSRKYR